MGQRFNLWLMLWLCVAVVLAMATLARGKLQALEG